MPIQERLSSAHSEPAVIARSHRTAKLCVTWALLVLAIWVARFYLTSLAWAVLLAIATWPLYARFGRLTARPFWTTLAPAIFALLMSLLVFVPLALVGMEIGYESRTVLGKLSEITKNGAEPPNWLNHIPILGGEAEELWRKSLSDPERARELLSWSNAGTLASISKDASMQAADQLVHVLITFIALFVLYRDGTWLANRVTLIAVVNLGDLGRRLTEYLVMATRGVVNGLVLNALGVGSLITVGYLVAGVPYPLLFGVFTAALAMIPLGAWIAIGTASLALLVQNGSPGHAAALFGFGAAVMIISDNVTQPMLVGGAAELPFLAVLIGILGGLETFGLVGLFLGPLSMAAILFLWREWNRGMEGLVEGNALD